MTWLTMNMLHLDDINNRSFDYIIDKCAMDALLTDEGSPWQPNPKCLKDVNQYLSHINRIMIKKFILISFGQPHFRINSYLKYHLWDISYTTFGQGFGYFFYVLTLNKNKKIDFDDLKKMINHK